MFSKRIEEIAKQIAPYKRIADIGSDHAYLVIDAFNSLNIEYAFIVDNKEEPLNNAINNIKNYNLFDKVDFSLSSGLSELPNSIDVVIISGMGGKLIEEIIKKDFEKLMFVKRLVIEANKDQYNVRKLLTQKGFYIYNQIILEDFKKFYEIDVYEKGYKRYEELDYSFGPILRNKKEEVYLKKWNMELSKYKRLYEKEKLDKIVEKIKFIEKAL